MLLNQGFEEPYYFEEYSTDYELYLILGFEILIKNEEISRAIKKLSENKKRIILLRYFAGFNDREISKILGLNPKTIWYQKTQAIKDLKLELGGKQDENYLYHLVPYRTIIEASLGD